jgi:hypothetical protein
MKKIIFTLLFIFTSSSFLFAQSKINYITPYTEARNHSKGFKVGLGYFQSSFLNENFRQNIEDKTLIRKPGLVFRMSYNYSPITFDFNWFSSGFMLDENHPLWQTYFNTKERLRHRGADIGVNFLLIPTSKYISPYAGGGYQMSSLGIVNLITSIETKEEKEVPAPPVGSEFFNGRVNMSSPFWRVGVFIFPHELLQISAEYRASVSLPTSRQFNQFAVTLSYNPFPK